ncbi:aminodeoxychorismate synthase component I [Arcobacter sp. AHV-9/2010]|uniref:aminodeoxychorismate synthase component I n=1 Tax=Arcobacter sp. AHV-9/2010 TaxID=2021861 RepID=UPI00100B8525|nr:aminodeoxychorismate synthase component I [Arcobacter sp. CECT 9299]RXJ96916.1 aminodeoxychorismate synthase component I [Arcobacter sp. CECT 9299]
MKIEKIKEKLNFYGSCKEPFLFLLSYDLKIFYIEKLSKKSKKIRYKISSKNSKNQKNSKKYFFKKYPIDFKNYNNKFQTIQEQIRAGNTYLANLTSQTKIDTNLSLNHIYKTSNSLLKLRVKLKKANFVCFSPEKFIDIVDDKIYTYPMKGTIDKSIKESKELLLNSTKELAEHTMIVDLLRNDLGKVAKNIEVEEFRFIDEIKTDKKVLLQTSSKISGKLDDNWSDNLGDILLALLPAGSITGTPKRSTIDILKKVENYNRGFYTGIFGVFDGKNLQSFVLIRFIEKIDGELFYKSGGGITSDSKAKDEYKELIDKIYLPF